MARPASPRIADPLPAELEKALERFLAFAEQKERLSSHTVDAYRRDLRRYLHTLAEQGVESLSQVRQEQISFLLRILREAGLTPSTVARNLSSIKRFHQFLLACGALQSDPAGSLEPPRLERRLPDFLSVEEVEKLMAVPNTADPLGLRDRAILELLYASGMRVSELVSLERRSLLLDSALVQIGGTSTHERLVPIGEQAVLYVRRYLEEVRPHLSQPASGEIVFLNARGSPLSRMGVWKIIHSTGEKAGLQKEVSPHTLRHSFAAHLLEGGANLRAVQELLGHATISTTQIYARLDRQYLKEVHRTYHPRG